MDPHKCLPLCLDVGTNNDKLLQDPSYIGLRQKRLRGREYDSLIGELMTSLRQWRPHCLVQFEDFANSNAFRLLQRYRSGHCAFNDDIQGTACVTLAALLTAFRACDSTIKWKRILFYGAGEAGIGIGELIAEYLVFRHGMTHEEARKHCIFMDSKGLVCQSRLGDLQHHKRPFAHELPFIDDLEAAVRELKPAALVGVSAVPGAFTPGVLAAMAEVNERPIIFPLSNPTSMSECSFEQCLASTQGKALFASGSPFAPARHPVTGETVFASQSNNAYVFPAVGAAAVLTSSHTIADEDFLAAAETLAAQAKPEHLAVGLLFPPFAAILQISAEVAAAVAKVRSRTPPGNAKARSTHCRLLGCRSWWRGAMGSSPRA